MSKVEQSVITVGIGASAGGLEAFKVLLECLPIDTGLSFVVIQHLAAGQESMLSDILSRFTKMPVQAIKNKMTIEPDHVYVIPPGNTMTMENKTLFLNSKVKPLKPIDTFFVSLAEDSKNQSIGIVLSGTGSDGTEGLKAIKAQGGITFAQTPNSAQYGDMPQNAISAEAADFILTPEKIAAELQKIAMNPQLARSEIASKEEGVTKEAKPKKETALNAIFAMLKFNCNVDFSHYKETVVNRRVTRRMVINHMKKIASYAEFLRTHPSELEALYSDMLIGVTGFFREPETFAALKEKIFPELIKNRLPKEPIRIWIPGCSTGEEAYSFAIAIQEYIEENSLTSIQVQVFGTDVNEKNIEKARQGSYPKTIETDIPEKRLKHFFKSFNGNYLIAKNIRDMCVFAKQDITSDPPFSNMDLISCRNMLIYFDAYLHEKVLPTLHYALKIGGFLVLGQSESIGKFTNLFEPLKKTSIYAKKRAQPGITFGLQVSAGYQQKMKEVKSGEKKDALAILKDEVDRLLVTEYVPAALLVNSNSDVLLFRGNIAPFVLPESGLASFNIGKIIRKELKSEVQTMIYRAKKEDKPIKENAIRLEFAGEQKTINIQVIPLHIEQFEEPFFLILSEDISSAAALLRQTLELASTPQGQENAKNRQIKDLREELESTKLSLQRIIETQEATNEELRTTMEEAQSSNEELQSTNEELETAKEELQSSNEELKTLNDEVKNRNETLAHLNDDLLNLNRNIGPAIILIDKSLRIRLFSPSAQRILNLSPSTVGLPLTSIKLKVNVEDLESTISEVISKLHSVTKEVKDEDGHYYDLKVGPYITLEDKIDGAVLSFIDITEHKLAGEKLSAVSFYSRSLIEASLDPLVTISKEGKITDVNKATEDVTGCSREELIGSDFSDYFTDPKEARAGYQKVFSEGLVKDYPLAIRHKSGMITDVLYNASIYRNLQGEVQGVFAAARDITAQKKAENQEREASKKLKDAERLVAIGATAGMVGHDIRNPLQAITGDVYLVKTELASIPESDEKKNALESLQEIEKNVDYINKIVADLQDYARPLNPRAQETDIKSVFNEILAKNGIPKNVKVTVEVEDKAEKIIADPDYLKRIAANLTLNAVQAMPNGGKLMIHAFADKKTNDVLITIKDTGVGIPEDIKPKLFTPMMTTKSKGQGFGLAVVKRMTEGLGGTVTFESTEGKGTTFIIRLPPPKKQ